MIGTTLGLSRPLDLIFLVDLDSCRTDAIITVVRRNLVGTGGRRYAPKEKVIKNRVALNFTELLNRLGQTGKLLLAPLRFVDDLQRDLNFHGNNRSAAI